MKIFKYYIIARKITTGKSKLINVATIVAIISIILGNLALILSLSVLDGFDNKLHEIAVKFTSHISARSFNKEPLSNYKEAVELLNNKYSVNNENNITNDSKQNYNVSTKQDYKIANISAIIEKEALIRSKDYIDGVLVRGIKNGKDIKNLKSYFVKGNSDFSASEAKEIFISNRLAERLNVKLGDKIILYSIIPSEDSQIPNSKVMQFKLKGIYATGFATWDDLLVIIPLKYAQSLFGIDENAVTTLEISLQKGGQDNSKLNSSDQKAISELALKMENEIGYPYYFQTVYDFHRAIFNWIALQKEPIPLVLGLISLVAGLNIITALIIAVVEKTHSIGILRTLGMSKTDIRMIFAIRGLFIGIVGATIGCGLAFIITFSQSYFHFFKLNAGVHFLDSVPVSIDVSHYVLVFILSVFLSLLASWIPSIAATRISPLKAIKFK